MITSLENKTVKQLCKLHMKKYREDSFLLTEEAMIRKAKEKGFLKKLVYTGDLPFDFTDALEVSPEVLNKIAEKEGLTYIGVSKMIDEVRAPAKRVLLLDRLQDPLNIGRIMEAAQLFGFDSLILSKECADIYNEKCLDACAGGIYELNICHADLLEEVGRLKEEGFYVCATGLRDNTYEMHEVETRDRMAFILGNEGSGVLKELMDASDCVMKIDMRNIDSLNVGMAASIIMYRFRI
ncbi:MAG: RNA methyltransferase [Erysipelotrichaceae bacterium]|nr:RNA methyltransferase [Erysipelotrichaceae bacterium]